MIGTKQKIIIFSVFILSFFLLSSGNKAQASEYVGVGWTAPTLNADSSTYTDPGGFMIYYDTISHRGTCPSSYASISPYAHSVNVTDPNAVHQVIGGLTAGTAYYFTMVAYDSSHNISTCVPEVSHTIKYSAIFDNGTCVGPGQWSVFHAHYGQSGNVAQGDADRDGTIGPGDWSIFHAEYGRGTGCT